MPDANVVTWIREKYTALMGDLDERGRRRWAATEARSLGRGGIAAVAEATGLSDRTVRNGLAELADSNPIGSGRQSAPAAGEPVASVNNPNCSRHCKASWMTPLAEIRCRPFAGPAKAPGFWRLN